MGAKRHLRQRHRPRHLPHRPQSRAARFRSRQRTRHQNADGPLWYCGGGHRNGALPRLRRKRLYNRTDHRRRRRFSRQWSQPVAMKSNQHPTNGTRGIKRIDLAYVELASSENARDINRDIVLEIIRSQQPVARPDLARPSGLQPSTISAIVEQLISEKWVSEGATARRPRGRPSTLLSLNDAMVILVADLHPNN